MQKGNVIGLHRHGLPLSGQAGLKRIHTQQRRRVGSGQRVQLHQRWAQVAVGQQDAGLGVGQNRQQTLLMMTARRFRRIRRNRNHARIQATKKRRHVVRPAGEQQYGAVARPGRGLQGRGDGPRALVQVAIAQHLPTLRIVCKKA